MEIQPSWRGLILVTVLAIVVGAVAGAAVGPQGNLQVGRGMGILCWLVGLVILAARGRGRHV